MHISAINSEKHGMKSRIYLDSNCVMLTFTHTSCFMDIQQWEKESLAAYVHQFKMEAKCCNFTNDTASIRIFIKRLSKAHSLAARIY